MFRKYGSVDTDKTSLNLATAEALNRKNSIETKLSQICFEMQRLETRKKPFYSDYLKLQDSRNRAQKEKSPYNPHEDALATQFFRTAQKRKVNLTESLYALIDEKLTELRTLADKKAQPIVALQTTLLRQQLKLMSQLNEINKESQATSPSRATP